ncbi:hypothetical protein [Streptomyces apocyni]|uniref:hypothetical protein n=1 Tax=Streptomyces apocyni TaxID=2654677 RepID=UPI0012EA38EC|nr:hypothetical protein [Streptomyces apocyni]
MTTAGLLAVPGGYFVRVGFLVAVVGLGLPHPVGPSPLRGRVATWPRGSLRRRSMW